MNGETSRRRENMKHNIFISYRREGGFETARYLYDHLKWDGYIVTFDLDTLRNGRFDKALLARIDECTDFIVVLSKGCFDRSLDSGFPKENDWLRKELGYAIEKGKNVIPVPLGAFEFPAKLPDDIDGVRFLNGPTYSKEYIDSFYGKIKVFLKTPEPGRRTTVGKKFMHGAGWLLFAGILAASLLWRWNPWHAASGISAPVPAHEEKTLPVPEPTLQTELVGNEGEEESARYEAGESIRLRVCDGFVAELVWCPPGAFNMGSPTNEIGRATDERLHPVRLSHGFWMAKYPTTQREWRLVMGSNPSWFKDNENLSEELRNKQSDNPAFDKPDYPVEHVSWFDCSNFLEKASALAGCLLRFPTEAEWEYACRAGSSDAYCWGWALNGDWANVDGRHPCASEIEGPFLEHPSPVGSYPPNAWGLYDMHGNVFEWTQDFYGEYPDTAVLDPKGPPRGATKVVRGGNWCNFAKAARSAARHRAIPSAHNARTGFRFCMDALPDDLDE